jgi:hypothetical protein
MYRHGSRNYDTLSLSRWYEFKKTAALPLTMTHLAPSVSFHLLIVLRHSFSNIDKCLVILL